MIRRFSRTLSLPAALLAAGAAPPAEPEPGGLRPGLYEVTVRPGDLSGLEVPAADAAEIARRVTEMYPPTRECEPGGTPRAGQSFGRGQCRYTRVADRGHLVDRSVTCAPVAGEVTTLEITGTTERDSYKLHAVAKSTDAETGRVLEMEGYEEGRRVGECPA